MDARLYYQYLRSRSVLSYVYRRYYLYPRLSRHLGGRVLDIGCGIGDFLRFHGRAIGIDINLHNVGYCRSRGLRACPVADRAYPFRDSSFDSAIMDNVLEHIVEPAPILKEIHRVLRPGGKMVVGVPGPRGYDADSDHKCFYDEAALISCLLVSGFRFLHTVHMPFRSQPLSRRISQYSIYGVFRRV